MELDPTIDVVRPQGFADELVSRWAEAEAGVLRAEASGDHELAEALRGRADDLRRLAAQHDLSLPAPRCSAA